jgi:hypothetical protein
LSYHNAPESEARFALTRCSTLASLTAAPNSHIISEKGDCMDDIAGDVRAKIDRKLEELGRKGTIQFSTDGRIELGMLEHILADPKRVQVQKLERLADSYRVDGVFTIPTAGPAEASATSRLSDLRLQVYESSRRGAKPVFEITDGDVNCRQIAGRNGITCVFHDLQTPAGPIDRAVASEAGQILRNAGMTPPQP